MNKIFFCMLFSLSLLLHSRETKQFGKVYDIPNMTYHVEQQAGIEGIIDFSIDQTGNFLLYNNYDDKIYFLNNKYEIIDIIENFSSNLPGNTRPVSLANNVQYKDDILFTVSEFNSVLISNLKNISAESYSFNYEDYLSNWYDYSISDLVYIDKLVIGELDDKTSRSYYSFEIPKNFTGKVIYRDTEGTLDYIRDHYGNKESLWVDENNFIHNSKLPLIYNAKTFYDYFDTKSPDVFNKLTQRALGLKFIDNDNEGNYYYESQSNVIYIFDNNGQYLIHFDNNLTDYSDYRSSYCIDPSGNVYCIGMSVGSEKLTMYKIERDW